MRVFFGLIMMWATGCGSAMEVVGAVGDYQAADAEWEAFQSEKARKARAGYEAGIALHEKYMSAKLPELPATEQAVKEWGTQSKRIIDQLEAHFRPVMYTHFYDKVFFAHLRLGEASEKRAKELLPLWEPLKGDARMMSESYVLEALMDTATFYKFAASDAAEHEEVGKRYGAQAAEAKRKSAEYKAKYEALRAAD
jgi:hypothetical protein